MVAERQRVTPQMVSKWRAPRFVEHRLDGLLDAPRSGAPRTIDDARVDAVIVNFHAELTHWVRFAWKSTYLHALTASLR